MSDELHDQRTLEMLLAGTPGRVIDAVQGVSPDAQREIDALRESLASLGLALPATPVTEAARTRLADAVARVAPPGRSPALVVMDMLVDHLTPGAPLEVPRARDIVPSLQRSIAHARAEGTPVVYLVDHHDPGDPELDAWCVHNTGDPIDDVWPALRPAPEDVVVPHRSYSGFYDTTLEQTLRRLGVDTVVLTGCITEIHLFVTAIDALQRGFRVEMPAALQAGSSALVEQVVMKTLSALVPTTPLPTG